MKILYLVTKSEAGGAQTHVYQLSRYFVNKGNQVAIMASPGGWLQEQAKKIGVNFMPNVFFSNTLNPIGVVKAFFKIKRAINCFKPDIVHCHSSVAGFLGRLAVRNKIPTIFTAHGWGFNLGVPWWQKKVAIVAEKMASRYCCQIVCVCDFVKQLALKYKVAREDKTVVIYNGIEPVGAEQPSHKSGKFKIVFIGRLAKPKLPILLLEAFNDLPTELKDQSELLIIGDGPQKESLEQFSNQKNLKQVQLAGDLSREEIFATLQQSNIFVFLSQWEGLPYTILEAMRAGLPVIASDVGGVKEMVSQRNGILIKDNKKEVVTRALRILLEDRQMIEVMGKQSITSINEKFALNQMLKKVEILYNRFVSGFLD
ncbi:MAG: glycosyltransferase family 4 protein [bacterium]